MLDRYIWGQVDRISPEAPVPVVCVTRESLHAGGAGNVVANIRALGGTWSLVEQWAKTKPGNASGMNSPRSVLEYKESS